MNVMEHDYAIREKANQMGTTLWSLGVASMVGFILWTSGSPVPWWVYPISFVQSVVGLARMLSDQPGLDSVDLARPIEGADEHSAAWPSQGMPLSKNLS
jgi:hypothetical protein